MSKYADIEQIKKVIREAWVKYMSMEFDMNISFVLGKIAEVPTIEIVRCKDCVYYDPPHVINNGDRIEYSDLPQEMFGVAEHIVSSKYGVNVGGRCTVDYLKGYSEDKRVYRQDYNYCGYGKQKESEE